MHDPCTEKDALTVDDFCQRHSLSRGKFYSLVAEGRAPRLMRVGRRTLISREAAADWRRAMEDIDRGRSWQS